MNTKDLNQTPSTSQPKTNEIDYDVAIIGAGVSGATLAQEMVKAGKKVVVLDKARGSGGRLSAKRILMPSPSTGGENQVSGNDVHVGFDLGCSSFNATTAEFREQAESWVAEGILCKSAVSHTPNASQETYYPVPRSSFLTKSLLSNVDVHYSVRVTRIEKRGEVWSVQAGVEGLEEEIVKARQLVLAVPAQQAADLLATDNKHKRALESVEFHPQWVVMLVLPNNRVLEKSQINDVCPGLVKTLVRDSDKQGHTAVEGHSTWVLHLTSEWTKANLSLDKSDVAQKVAQLVEELLESRAIVKSQYAHRWLYSTVKSGLSCENGVLKLDDRLYGCGDWVNTPGPGVSLSGVESAFLAAQRLALQLNADDKN